MQLEHWGIDYFDLYLVHFPVALAYVDPAHRYPPEWWGDDGKSVTVRRSQSPLHPLFPSSKKRRTNLCRKKARHSRRHGAPWKNWSTRDL